MQLNKKNFSKFNKCFEAHYFCRNLVRVLELEDFVNECFLNLCRWGEFDSTKSSLTTLAYLVARQTEANVIKRIKRLKRDCVWVRVDCLDMPISIKDDAADIYRELFDDFKSAVISSKVSTEPFSISELIEVVKYRALGYTYDEILDEMEKRGIRFCKNTYYNAVKRIKIGASKNPVLKAWVDDVRRVRRFQNITYLS